MVGGWVSCGEVEMRKGKESFIQARRKIIVDMGKEAKYG
jgi:hypothetical protein